MGTAGEVVKWLAALWLAITLALGLVCLAAVWFSEHPACKPAGPRIEPVPEPPASERRGWLA
jgi:hypothetical protein